MVWRACFECCFICGRIQKQSEQIQYRFSWKRYSEEHPSMRKTFKGFGASLDEFGFSIADSMSTVSSKFTDSGIKIWESLSNTGSKISSFGNGIGKSMSKGVKNATSALSSMSSKAATILKPFSMAALLLAKHFQQLPVLL